MILRLDNFVFLSRFRSRFSMNRSDCPKRRFFFRFSMRIVLYTRIRTLLLSLGDHWTRLGHSYRQDYESCEEMHDCISSPSGVSNTKSILVLITSPHIGRVYTLQWFILPFI